MGIEIESVRAICSKCGTDYSRQKGYFPVSYAILHKGVGHTHVCKKCIDEMYNGYLSQCNNAKDAVRQVCRKLDLYWSDSVYRQVERKATTRSMMTQYISKINTVSSLLFNNEKASANALALSVKADQAITFGIVKSIEDVINRYIQSLSYGKNFKVTFLDVSPYNRKEAGEAYLKACQYGIPLVSYYCASQGLGQAEMDCMNFLENEILDIKSTFVPLQSSSTQSANDSTDEGGAKEKDTEELTDSGEQSREQGSDWG